MALLFTHFIILDHAVRFALPHKKQKTPAPKTGTRVTRDTTLVDRINCPPQKTLTVSTESTY